MKRKYAIIGLLLFISGSVGALVISTVWSSHSHPSDKSSVGSSLPLKAAIPFIDNQAPHAAVYPVVPNLAPMHGHKDKDNSPVLSQVADIPAEIGKSVAPVVQSSAGSPSPEGSELGAIENPSEYVTNSDKTSIPIKEDVQRLFPDLIPRMSDPHDQPFIWGYFYCDPCTTTTVPASTVPESSYSLIAGLVFLTIWRIAYKH